MNADPPSNRGDRHETQARCNAWPRRRWRCRRGAAQAQISDGVVKIGVLNDQSGLYADLAGQGSVVAAQDGGRGLRRREEGHEGRGGLRPTTRTSPTSARSIARQWYDVDKVDVIVDVPTSSVALAVNEITTEKNKVFLVSGAAISDLTGKACSPNTVHWTYDTWALANGTGNAIVKTGGDTWFFLTADYAFGHALERDTEAVVLKNGGKVLGKVRHPLTDARTSRRSCCRRRPRRPRSSASPTPAATPSTRSSRRPSSASSRAARTSPACWCSSPTCTRLGLDDGAGPDLHRVLLLGPERRRRAPSPSASRRPTRATYPTMVQAGVYSAVLHYLKAVEALKTRRRHQGGRQDEGDAHRRPAVRQGHDPRRRPQDPPDVPVRGEEAGRVARGRGTTTSSAPRSRPTRRSGRSPTAAARW